MLFPLSLHWRINRSMHLFALPFTAMEVATRTYLDTFREVIR
jgi:hypothetical protein